MASAPIDTTDNAMERPAVDQAQAPNAKADCARSIAEALKAEMG